MVLKDLNNIISMFLGNPELLNEVKKYDYNEIDIVDAAEELEQVESMLQYVYNVSRYYLNDWKNLSDDAIKEIQEIENWYEELQDLGFTE